MMVDYFKLNMLKRLSIIKSIFEKINVGSQMQGVIIAAEKLLTSKLLTKNTNRRIYQIDNHIGIVFSYRPSMVDFQMAET